MTTQLVKTHYFCDELWDIIKSYLRKDYIGDRMRKLPMTFLGKFCLRFANTRVMCLANTSLDTEVRKKAVIRALMKYHYRKQSILKPLLREIENIPKRKVPDPIDWNASGHVVGRMVRWWDECRMPEGNTQYQMFVGRIIKINKCSIKVQAYEYGRINDFVTLFPQMLHTKLIKRRLSRHHIHSNETVQNEWNLPNND